jgi:site-specific DNA-methyltransferase (adenine-specific)
MEARMRVETIGDCTLYLGDSVELAGGLAFDAVVSDPPYGMAFQSNYRLEKHDVIANDKGISHLLWACDLHAEHSKYVFCRWDNLVSVPRPRSLVTWVKNNWSMGDLEHEHARQTEVALFYPGPGHFFPAGRPTDVVEAPRTGNEHHPTEKPVQLMWAVVRWTAGVVFDPFMGSGTTGVACARHRRRFVGVEIEQKYFDIACRRIEAAYKQPDMFVERPAKPVQEALL